MKKILLFLIISLILVQSSYSYETSSLSYRLSSVFDEGGNLTGSTNYKLDISLGSLSNKTVSTSYLLWPWSIFYGEEGVVILICGNGVCNTELGENWLNCPVDCIIPPGGGAGGGVGEGGVTECPANYELNTSNICVPILGRELIKCPAGYEANASNICIPIPEIVRIDLTTSLAGVIEGVEGATIPMNLKGIDHEVTFTKIGANYVVLTIFSEPIEIRVGLKESLGVDIDEDKVYDIVVRLEKIENGRAEVVIKRWQNWYRLILLITILSLLLTISIHHKNIFNIIKEGKYTIQTDKLIFTIILSTLLSFLIMLQIVQFLFSGRKIFEYITELGKIIFPSQPLAGLIIFIFAIILVLIIIFTGSDYVIKYFKYEEKKEYFKKKVSLIIATLVISVTLSVLLIYNFIGSGQDIYGYLTKIGLLIFPSNALIGKIIFIAAIFSLLAILVYGPSRIINYPKKREEKRTISLLKEIILITRVVIIFGSLLFIYYLANRQHYTIPQFLAKTGALIFPSQPFMGMIIFIIGIILILIAIYMGSDVLISHLKKERKEYFRKKIVLTMILSTISLTLFILIISNFINSGKGIYDYLTKIGLLIFPSNVLIGKIIFIVTIFLLLIILFYGPSLIIRYSKKEK